MYLKQIAAVIATAGLLIGGMAFADHGPDHQGMFKSADANNDGKLSHEEFKAYHDKHMEEMFKNMDGNGDGFIDQSEKKAMHEKMREHRMDHCARKGGQAGK